MYTGSPIKATRENIQYSRGLPSLAHASMVSIVPLKFCWLYARLHSHTWYFPQVGGPQYRPQHTITLVVGSPGAITTILGTPHLLAHDKRGYEMQPACVCRSLRNELGSNDGGSSPHLTREGCFRTCIGSPNINPNIRQSFLWGLQTRP